MLVKLTFLCLVGFTVLTNLRSKFNLLTFCNERPAYLLRHLFFQMFFQIGFVRILRMANTTLAKSRYYKERNVQSKKRKAIRR